MGKKKDFVLLVKICELMKEKDYNLSKISLQQLVYILQQLYGVESSYEFKLYTYGPYSTELTEDLDELVSRPETGIKGSLNLPVSQIWGRERETPGGSSVYQTLF